MIFASPIMLAALAALPALAAIYWLRHRSRRQVVSSLFLFEGSRSRQGGRIFERMQTPLAFFLELLALAAIAMAAAGPSILKKDATRPLIVVLDDSFSMQARNGQTTPRGLAQAAILDELKHNAYRARFIIAGVRPVLSGDSMPAASSATAAMDNWECLAPQADLGAAVALAGELGGPSARILVVSDHAPPSELFRENASAQAQWWAFGTPLPNIAITAAARTSAGDSLGQKQRVLLEVANFSPQAASAVLHLGIDGAAETSQQLQLGSHERRQITLDLPASNSSGENVLRAHLDSDNLDFDNAATLLPPPSRRVRVQVSVTSAALRTALVRAAQASGLATIVADAPELTISDLDAAPEGLRHAQAATDAQAGTWQVRVQSAGNSLAFAGPFIVDRNHPLTEGLSLAGVVWACPADAPLPGTPVVTAGNTTLVSCQELSDGTQSIGLAISPELSNVTQSPDWPILMSNLLRWRLSALELMEPNVRLGSSVRFSLPQVAGQNIAQLQWHTPDGKIKPLDVRAGQLELTAQIPGLHHIQWAGGSASFAVNVAAPDESDLSQCVSGRWGDWNNAPAYKDVTVDLSWMALLAALAALTGEMLLVRRRGGAGT
jgi:hypothetical protein